MNDCAGLAHRSCPGCEALEPIRENERVWPIGWTCPACGHVVAQSAEIPMLAPELADTVSGFDPILFAALAKIEADHFWFVARNELIVGLADRFFPAARHLLEIGCGNGAVLRALASSRRWKRVVGSDLHPTGLAHARERMPDDVELVQMNALAIPARETFDLIGAFDIVEHVEDDEGVLRAMRRSMRPSGGAIISAPQHPWLWSGADEIAHHQRRYCRGELESKLRRNGFEVLFSSSFTATLLPLMAASRAKARLWPGNGGLGRELAVAGQANATLLAILRAEVRLTLTGARWPVGGSRMVVARALA